MAKRFTDTGLVRKKWYRKLSPAHKAAWQFITAECDEAGVWSIDEDSLEFHVGEFVSLDEFIAAVNLNQVRVKKIDSEKLFVVDFVLFQYGELSEACKPHQRSIRLLKHHRVWEEYLKGLQTLKDKEKEKDKDKEEDQEGGVGGNHAPPEKPPVPSATPPPAHPVTKENVAECMAEWKKTLEHFEIARGPDEINDEPVIARAILKHGADWVKLALSGARKQKAGPRFDPTQFVSLRIYLHNDKIERLVNIGAGKESAEGVDWGKVFS